MKKFLVALLGIILVFACNQDELNSLISSSTEQAGVIASIKEQVENINATIEDLKAADTVINLAIDALNNEDVTIRAQLEADKAKIEASIDSLENYVNEKLQEAQDWASATFATLEQYQHLCDSVAAIQQSLVELDSRITAQLKHDLDSLETSMKVWVNEQLTGYYTIAQMDAKLGVLEKAVQDGDKANADAITQLQADLAKQATDLTTAYQAAIASAIEESNGVINEKIANEINTVNTRITNEVKALGDRIDTLELRIQAVEDYINSQKAFTISFTMPKDTVCFPGETITVGYEVSESTLPTAIECIPDQGWKATVHSNGNKGTISITAPNTGGNGKVVVFANRSSWILMSTIKLQEGVLSIDKDVYNAPFEGCVLDIPFSINADYGIKVAEADQSWLHVKETKATMRNETLSLIVDANPNQFRRIGRVYIYPAEGNNDEYYQLTINQATTLQAIDLGLSVKWASFNLGGDSAEEYGDHYAWGEVSAKDEYNWSTYEWCNGTYNSLTKYNTNGSFGIVDNKTVLDLKDDAAHFVLGGKWRIPTDGEWTELKTQCTWTWTTENDIHGSKVTGPNGNSIFLPAAGFRNNTDIFFVDSLCNYWSSSLVTDRPSNACRIYFSSDSVVRLDRDRFYGRSIRPVCE